MTDKEKIIKELKEALDSLDITNKYRLNLIKAIEYLQEEPVSEDLEEAIDEYAPDFSNSIASKAAVDAVRDAFKAGAEWQKEKDFILTWVDIRDILILNSKVQNDIFGEPLDDYKLCNEILRRFKQRKG